MKQLYVRKNNRTRNINLILSAAIIIVNLYILVFPFVPLINSWLEGLFGQQPSIVAAYNSKKIDSVQQPQGNLLVIPRLSMQENINEGKTAAALKSGVWHRPLTSTPNKKSNTVLVGHRLTYEGKAVFYSLDKLKKGDDIFVYWEGKRYQYKVNSIDQVPASAIEVESAKGAPTLTLYTCTPLWTAKDRLVVTSSLVDEVR